MSNKFTEFRRYAKGLSNLDKKQIEETIVPDWKQEATDYELKLVDTIMRNSIKRIVTGAEE